MTPAKAKETVSKLIGVPSSLIAVSEPGVYLVNQEPSQGRAAYLCRIAAGENQKAIEVYLDPQSGKILSIK